MVVNMVVKPSVYLVHFALNSQENLLVLCVLLGVPSVEPGQPPHHGSANNGDDDRNPPSHDSHPTIPDRLGLDASLSRLALLFALAFTDSGAMKIFLAVAKAKPNTAHVALETDGTSTWENVEGEDVSAFCAID